MAEIPPVAGADRPRWSVLIPTHNCARYLEVALGSVLAQDPGPEAMEILVVDDASDRDDPAAVVEALGAGRVRFLRQPTNVGKVRNYETGLRASRGHLVHQLHGDDLVLPGFYAAMGDAFDRFPEAGAFFCESDYIDAEGHVTGRTGRERAETGLLDEWLRRIVTAQRIQTPSMVVRREVYERLGGFDRRLNSSEDWEMWVRLSVAYPVGFCSEACAQYRSTQDNASAQTMLSGAHAQTQRSMFEIIDQYLPDELVREVQASRAQHQALFFAGFIPTVLRKGDFNAWARLCRQALAFDAGPSVLRRIGSLTVRTLLAGRREASGSSSMSPLLL